MDFLYLAHVDLHYFVSIYFIIFGLKQYSGTLFQHLTYTFTLSCLYEIIQ